MFDLRLYAEFLKLVEILYRAWKITQVLILKGYLAVLMTAPTLKYVQCRTEQQ